MKKTRLKLFVLILILLLSSITNISLEIDNEGIHAKAAEVSADTQYYYNKYSVFKYAETKSYTIGTFPSDLRGVTLNNTLSRDFLTGKYTAYYNVSAPPHGGYILDESSSGYKYLVSADGRQAAVYLDSSDDTIMYNRSERLCALDSFSMDRVAIVTFPTGPAFSYRYTMSSCEPRRGDLLQADIIAADKAYPDNGLHTDGYWYVKSTSPTITINAPVKNQAYNTAQTITPSIFVPYNFANKTLTCNYYIDSESIPRQTKTVSNSLNGNTVNFTTAINMSQLTIGSHTFRVTVSDGVVTAQNAAAFTVQLAPPATPPNLSATGTSTSISVTWSAVSGASKYELEADGIVKYNGTGTGYTHGSLLPGTSHTYRVRAVNSAGSSSWSTAKTAYTLSPAPTGITAAATANSAVINWNTVTNATGYEIETKDGVIDRGTNTTYTHSSLLSGTQYTYRVRAKNASGAGAWSGSVSCLTIPGSPVVTSTSATANSVTVNWNAVTGATGYSVKADGSSSAADTGTNTTYTHSGLLPNTAHTYTVYSRNSSGTSAASAAATKYTLANVPNNGTIGTKSQNSIQAAWQANGNPAATQYSLAAFDAGSNLVKQSAWSTSLNNTVTGLSSYTQYKIKVKAKNGQNIETGWYEIGTEATLPDPPFTPTNVKALNIDNSSITLSWDAMARASGYNVRVDGVIVMDGGLVKEITANSYISTGLLGASTHTYEICAKNPGGTSAWSTPLSVTTLPDPPDTPANLRVDSATTDTIKLSWDASARASGYTIKIDGIEKQLTETTYTITGLIPGSRHTFCINASNTGGSSLYSSDLVAYTMLEKPVNVTATATNTRMTISWDAVSGAASYLVKVGNTERECTGTTYMWTGLMPDTVYTYGIMAKNSAAFGLWSDERTKTTLPGIPEIPSGLKAEAAASMITVTWDASSGSTGYEIEADGLILNNRDSLIYRHTGLMPDTEHTYRVRARNSAGKSGWSSITIVSTPPVAADVPKNLGASIQDNGINISWDPVEGAESYDLSVNDTYELTVYEAVYMQEVYDTGKEYKYAVRSEKSGLKSDWSTAITVMSGNNEYSVVQDVYTDPSIESITITWSQCEGATGYDILADTGLVENITETEYIHDNLSPETSHTYKVRAKYGNETGPWSDTVIAATLPAPAIPPSGVGAIASINEIVLYWEPVSNATGYDVYADGIIEENITDTMYTHNGLIPESAHSYRVRTRADNSVSDWSSIYEKTTLSNKPGVPANITAAASNNAITLMWSMAAGATQYEIETDGGEIIRVSDISYTHGQLQQLIQHSYRVRALNGELPGNWSEAITKTTLSDPPAVPLDIKITAASNSLTAVWEAVYNAESYDIEFDGISYDNRLNTTYTKDGLYANAQHNLRIRAKNSGGAGAWSGYMTVLTQSDKPGVPSDINANQTGNTTTITWMAVEGAIGYEIEADGRIINNGTSISYTDTGLLPGTKHDYRVRSVNSGGTSDWSAVLSKVIPIAVPVITTEARMNSININWVAVEQAEGYEIEVDGAVIDIGNSTAYTHMNLTPNSKHSYRVRAKNTVTTGEWTDIYKVQTSGVEYVMTCTEGDMYNVVIAADNIISFDSYKFVVMYNPNELEVVDLCGGTPGADFTAGLLNGTYITVTKYESGIVEFISGYQVQEGQAYTGVVNSIKFRSRISGQTTIIYSELQEVW